MMLYKSAGIKIEVPTVDNDTMDILVIEAEDMLKSGLVLTTHDWSGLDENEKNAFVRAGNSLRKEMAIMTGISAQGVAHAAVIWSDLDKGEVRDELKLQNALNRITTKLHNDVVEV